MSEDKFEQWLRDKTKSTFKNRDASSSRNARYKAFSEILKKYRELVSEANKAMNKYDFEDEDTMIRKPGDCLSFRCECQCNVFKKSKCGNYFKCNSCNNIYHGE
jgi:hypothetical protein